LQVSANPELRGVVAKGGDMLPVRVVQQAFKHLHGTPLNFVQFGKAVQKLDKWYQDRGVLGQVRCRVEGSMAISSGFKPYISAVNQRNLSSG
jgi:hypothetical protein